MNDLTTERAIEVLYTVRAYYASLTAGYPKGKDCRGIGDVMCSEIANSCLMAIKALEQQPCEDCISRQATVERLCKVAEFMNEKRNGLGSPYVMAALFIQDNKDEFPSVTSQPKVGEWLKNGELCKCSNCHSLVLRSVVKSYNYCFRCGAKMEVSE